MNIKLSFIVTTILSIGVLLAITSKANAAEFQIESQELTIKIPEEGSSTVNLTIVVKNNDQANLIGGYEIEVPYNGINNLTATLDAIPIEASIGSINTPNKLLLSLNFSSFPVKPGEQKTLFISFTASNTFIQKNTLTYLIVPQIIHPEPLVNNKVIIEYPKSFGIPSFSSTVNYSVETSGPIVNRLISNISKSFMVMWGEEYFVDLESSYEVISPKENQDGLLINLPEENINQQVVYKEIMGGEFGLIDEFNNLFFVTNSNSEGKYTVGFKARVEKIIEENFGDFNINYDWNVKEDSKFGQKIISEMNKVPDDQTKLRNVFNLLLSEFEPSINDSYDINNINKIWDEANNDNLKSSFEYSYFLITASERLGFKANLKYGYVLIPDLTESKFYPHFWTEIQTPESEFIVDPYLSDQLDFEYFGMENSLDRISFGTWKPEQNYNFTLGLFSKNSTYAELQKTDLGEFLSRETELMLDFNTSNKWFAGFYKSIDLKIDNPTNKIIKIKDIRFQDESVFDNYEYIANLQPVVLPMQRSNVPVKFRESNFFIRGESDITFEVLFENEYSEKASQTKSTKYFVDEKIITFTVIGFNIILIGLFWISSKKLIKGKSKKK